MLPLKWRDFCCQLNYHIQTNENLKTYCSVLVNRPSFQFAWIGDISKWKFSLSMRWMLINNKCNALNDTWTTTKQPLESFIETDIICIWLISNGFAQWKQFANFRMTRLFFQTCISDFLLRLWIIISVQWINPICTYCESVSAFNKKDGNHRDRAAKRISIVK